MEKRSIGLCYVISPVNSKNVETNDITRRLYCGNFVNAEWT